jgi:hypothetical protein
MEKIWSAEFIKANPELAENAIETLQMLVKDLEEKLNQVDLCSLHQKET